MRYAYCINGFEDFNANIDLACEAEEAGWDGFFLPDGLALEVPNHGAMPLFDPWVIMGAIAVKTTRIRFGTMITPISRRSAAVVLPLRRPCLVPARHQVREDRPSAHFQTRPTSA